MGRSTVDLVEHRAEWAEEFSRERERLLVVFGPSALSIEHIGSTAVPGLVAKPTIDIAVGLDDIAALLDKIPELEALGYEFRPEASFDDRHWFLRRIVGDERTHHLHVVGLPHPHWEEWFTFRDYLRTNPEAAGRYGAEKHRLAQAFYRERGRYVEAKTSIVQQLLAEAGARGSEARAAGRAVNPATVVSGQ